MMSEYFDAKAVVLWDAGRRMDIAVIEEGRSACDALRRLGGDLDPTTLQSTCVTIRLPKWQDNDKNIHIADAISELAKNTNAGNSFNTSNRFLGKAGDYLQENADDEGKIKVKAAYAILESFIKHFRKAGITE